MAFRSEHPFHTGVPRINRSLGVGMQPKVACKRQKLYHNFVFSVKFSLNKFPLFCGVLYMLCSSAYSIYVRFESNSFS